MWLIAQHFFHMNMMKTEQTDSLLFQKIIRTLQHFYTYYMCSFVLMFLDIVCFLNKYLSYVYYFGLLV